MSVYVASLKESDIDRIIEIETTSFSMDVRESKELYLKRISLFREGNLGFYKDQTLLGFFCSELWLYKERYEADRFTLNGDFETYHNKNGKELYISSFAVDRKYRNLIKGKVAFDLAVKTLLNKFNLESIILLVGQNWVAAHSIYNQWGFKEIYKIEGFFSNPNADGETAIIMRAKLPQFG
ncbi:MAG: GNAT family N-acetyltransferase [Sphaerochaetaceae bacterium]